MAQYEDIMAAAGGLDPLASPVPGESLTTDPDTPAPYEKPPVHTDVDVAMEDLFLRITEGEVMDSLINQMRAGTPVEDIAQVILFSGFREGKFNPDLLLMMIEPTIYLLLWVAEYAGVDPVLYPEDDLGIEFEEEGFDITEAPRPEGISESLLTKIQDRANKGVE